jgi:ERCC4-type nuclease
MTTVNCSIDVRERDLIPLLTPWPAKQLPVGDIWIGDDLSGGGLIIERKQTNDLEASILDGRYREQRTRLVTYCQQKGHRPVYLIEGPLDRLWGRLTEQVLQKHLNRLAIRYGIAVIRTESLHDTARICRMLCEQIQEDTTVFKQTDAATVAYTSTVHVAKKANSEDPKVFASRCLQGCPGVSDTMADALLKGCGGTLQQVLQATEETIANVKITEKRRVGPAVAKRLYALLHTA